jgi:hypothetical protein
MALLMLSSINYFHVLYGLNSPLVDIWCRIWYHHSMKKEKLLQKAINNPQNLRFAEFETLLGHYKFLMVNSTGSHFIYRNNEMAVTLPIQNTNGLAKIYQVRQFLEILRRNNAL